MTLALFAFIALGAGGVITLALHLERRDIEEARRLRRTSSGGAPQTPER